ncbi:uncharacterized protein LOC107845310 isoform X2 [Capsicum annuum]|uniref:uncharacterized protein LOC107845310 isoform X2 n=1 Tax=Capsicum annuum TaxID=4072 RepID=UPI001FB17930|nr:uncharacterized protein LOC107845310 isoform X2 [Capsicum annuum]XP_047254385.1 uncharacterized protein LOC107845310 isoform X2 [Capsicum annuum]
MNQRDCTASKVTLHSLLNSDEALLGGPVQCRWMYPWERKIGKCKRSVKQNNRFEGSICKAYLVAETSHFCSYYFEKHVPCLRHRTIRHSEGKNDPLAPPLSIFNQPGKGSKTTMRRFLTDMERKSATTHVLLNCPKVQSYYNLFLSLYGYDAVYSHFSEWFKSSVNDPNNNMTNQFFKDIAWGARPIG